MEDSHPFFGRFPDDASLSAGAVVTLCDGPAEAAGGANAACGREWGLLVVSLIAVLTRPAALTIATRSSLATFSTRMCECRGFFLRLSQIVPMQ